MKGGKGGPQIGLWSILFWIIVILLMIRLLKI
jgi:hypothetical protein